MIIIPPPIKNLRTLEMKKHLIFILLLPLITSCKSLNEFNDCAVDSAIEIGISSIVPDSWILKLAYTMTLTYSDQGETIISTEEIICEQGLMVCDEGEQARVWVKTKGPSEVILKDLGENEKIYYPIETCEVLANRTSNNTIGMVTLQKKSGRIQSKSSVSKKKLKKKYGIVIDSVEFEKRTFK